MQTITIAGHVGWPVPPEILRELIAYDPATGALTWLKRPAKFFKPDGYRSAEGCAANWNARYAGKPALSSYADGYLCGRLFDRTAKAHRVAWAIHHGEWPDQIDHINGDRADNRIENLRDVSVTENNRNLSLRKASKSGVVGVSYDRSRGQWRADIAGTSIGRFADKAAAIAARKAAEVALQFHPNHGRIA